MTPRDRLGRALVFYKDDVARIDRALQSYQTSSRSRCNLLVDLDGHLVTQVGALEGVDLTTVAALVAGSFKATREIARALGEEEFTSLSHQGADESIQVTLVSDRTILATFYSPRLTTAGLVAFYVGSAVAALQGVLDAIATRPPEGTTLEPGFGTDLGAAFDGLCGE